MSILPSFPPDWDAIELVGAGGYGRVYRCVKKKQKEDLEEKEKQQQQQNLPPVNENALSSQWNPNTVAIKVISYARETSSSSSSSAAAAAAAAAASPTAQLEGLKEATALQTSGPHPCLIRLHSCFYSLKYRSLCLVQEWADGPTLGDIYSTVGALPEKAMTTVTIDLLQALLQLHSSRTLHRDIKSPNVLTTKHGVCKLADLGVSALRPELGDYRKTYVGTAGFIAPEVSACGLLQQQEQASSSSSPSSSSSSSLNVGSKFGPMSARAASVGSGEGYNETSDVWSLGVTLLEGAIGQIQAHEYVAKVSRCFSLEAEATSRRNLQLGKPDPFPAFDSEFQAHRKQLESRMVSSVFSLSPDFADLLLSMLDPLPSRRPSCLRLLTKHPFCVKALEQMKIAAPAPVSPSLNFSSASVSLSVSPLTLTPPIQGTLPSNSSSAPSAAFADLEPSSPVPSCSSSSSPAAASSPLQKQQSEEAKTSAATTLAFLNGFSANKSFRHDFAKVIARIPRRKQGAGAGGGGNLPNQLVNPNKLLHESEFEEEQQGESTGASSSSSSSGFAAANMYRAPKEGSSFALPASKFIDVICALDFPTSSTSTKFSITAGSSSSSSATEPSPSANFGATAATSILPVAETSSNINSSSSSVVLKSGRRGKGTASRELLQEQEREEEEAFLQASRRVEILFSSGSSSPTIKNPNNNSNASPSNPFLSSLLSSSSSSLPFGSLFQKLILSSLDAATLRSARLDSWLDNSTFAAAIARKSKTGNGDNTHNNDGDHRHKSSSSPSSSLTSGGKRRGNYIVVGLGNADEKKNMKRKRSGSKGKSKKKKNKKKKKKEATYYGDDSDLDSEDDNNNNEDDDDDDSVDENEDSDSDSNHNNEKDEFDDVQNYFNDGEEDDDEEDQENQNSGGGAYYGDNNNNDNNNNINNSLERSAELRAFETLRHVIAECEATVPNFSESFFASLTDISAVDPAACALVSHAFDRGQWVTRHRDGLSHGLTLKSRAPQQHQQNSIHQSSPFSSSSPSSTSPRQQQQQQQQQQTKLTSREQAASSYTRGGGGTVENTTATMPLTGRRSAKATPRLGLSTNTVDLTSSRNALPSARDHTAGGGSSSSNQPQQQQQQQQEGESQSQQQNQQQQQQQARNERERGANLTNVFNPLSSSSLYMQSTIPTRISMEPRIEPSSSSSSSSAISAPTQNSQVCVEHWNVAIPNSMITSLRAVSSLSSSNKNNLTSSVSSSSSSSAVGGNNNNNALSDDSNGFSLNFRHRWLSVGAASRQKERQEKWEKLQKEKQERQQRRERQQQLQKEKEEQRLKRKLRQQKEERRKKRRQEGIEDYESSDDDDEDEVLKQFVSASSPVSDTAVTPREFQVEDEEGETSTMMSRTDTSTNFGGKSSRTLLEGGGGGGGGSTSKQDDEDESAAGNKNALDDDFNHPNSQEQKQRNKKEKERQRQQDVMFKVANGISEDGSVYASDLLFGHEAKQFHAQIASCLQGF